MAIVQYKEILMSELSNLPIAEGQLIYCDDIRSSFYDGSGGTRIEIRNMIVLNSLADLEALMSPSKDRIYVAENKIYRYINGRWNEVHDSIEINDIIEDVDLIVPVELGYGGNKISPKVLASSVHTEEGVTLEELLSNIVVNARTSTVVKSVIAQEQMQRSFTIPFPFDNYMQSGNSFSCYLGGLWIDPIRYTVSGKKLVFNNLDDGVGLGRKLSFVFIYNSVDPSNADLQNLDGNYIADGSIPVSKLTEAARLLTYSSFVEKPLAINESLVMLNEEYTVTNTLYYGGSRASITIHLFVKDFDNIYKQPIATIERDYIPAVPVENIIIATDRGPVDVSIDNETGEIWLGNTLKPEYPFRINGTIQYLL